IEGTIANVPPQGGRKHPNQECIQIDTTNILFLCGGAFIDLDKIVDARKDSSKLGFGSKVKGTIDYRYDELIQALQPADLIKFGLIPEFVGRVPIVVGLNALDEDTLIKILAEPKNALIKQYQTQFKLDNVELCFEDDALRAIAAKAIQLNTGARGLRSILEDVLLDLMYEIPSDKSIDKVVINAEVIAKTAKPKIVRIVETSLDDIIAQETDILSPNAKNSVETDNFVSSNIG
ncbi:MAG: AAA family ATPase, partial [Clostridia bacterium]